MLKKTPLLASLLLCSCSTVHYSSDLNKIRNVYDKKSENINAIAKNRESRITEKETSFSKKIGCLSEQYSSMTVKNKADSIKKAKSKSKSIAKLIDKNKLELDKLLYGGYERISKNTSGEITKREVFDKGIYDLGFDIQLLTIDVGKRQKREKILSNQTIKKMKDLDRKNREIFYLKNKRKVIEANLKKLEQERKMYASQIVQKPNAGFKSSKIGAKFAVANIFDKTGQVYSEKSTAISDMVENALSYNRAIVVVNTPYGEVFNQSRFNPLNPKSGSKSALKDARLISRTNGFVGNIFPSDIFLSGALVQYDDKASIKPFGTKARFDIDPLKINSSTKTITVGLVLRAVDSSNSSVIDRATLSNVKDFNSDKSSVYVENTFFVKKISADLFEIKSKRLYGGELSVEVADPVHYAVREMVEKATYLVLKQSLPKSLQIKANSCDSI